MQPEGAGPAHADALRFLQALQRQDLDVLMRQVAQRLLDPKLPRRRWWDTQRRWLGLDA